MTDKIIDLMSQLFSFYILYVVCCNMSAADKSCVTFSLFYSLFGEREHFKDFYELNEGSILTVTLLPFVSASESSL